MLRPWCCHGVLGRVDTLSHGPTPAAVAPEFVALHLLPEQAQPSVELVVTGVTVRADAGTDVDWLASLALALHRRVSPC